MAARLHRRSGLTASKIDLKAEAMAQGNGSTSHNTALDEHLD